MGPPDLDSRLRRFLAEDLGSGDVTAKGLVPERTRARAAVVSRSEGVIAGADLAEAVVRLLDPEARARGALRDGERVERGRTIVTLSGDARALLAAERTILNLLQRMSGIATLTAKFVAAVAGTGAAIHDTRKTAPGLRWFDKRAVAAGGGGNHRHGLWDMVLVKSNHMTLGARPGVGARAIEAAVAAARAAAGAGLRVAIEVHDAGEAVRAAGAGAHLVLLDNLAPDAVADAVRQVRARWGRDRVEIEASGGVQLGNVRAFAEAGVDRISIGALTHSAPALDLALELAAPLAGA